MKDKYVLIKTVKRDDMVFPYIDVIRIFDEEGEAQEELRALANEELANMAEKAKNSDCIDVTYFSNAGFIAELNTEHRYPNNTVFDKDVYRTTWRVCKSTEAE